MLQPLNKIKCNEKKRKISDPYTHKQKPIHDDQPNSPQNKKPKTKNILVQGRPGFPTKARKNMLCFIGPFPEVSAQLTHLMCTILLHVSSSLPSLLQIECFRYYHAAQLPPHYQEPLLPSQDRLSLISSLDKSVYLLS